MAQKCSVEACPETTGGTFCRWHEYRHKKIADTKDTIKIYENEGMARQASFYIERLAALEAAMLIPAPDGTLRSGYPARKRTVRAAVDRFLQAPGIATATDAHAAIDRYASEWKEADNADER